MSLRMRPTLVAALTVVCFAFLVWLNGWVLAVVLIGGVTVVNLVSYKYRQRRSPRSADRAPVADWIRARKRR